MLYSFVVLAFVGGLVLPSPAGYAQTALNLPAPGAMVPVTPAFAPAMIKGINLYADNPLKFDFLIDKGDTDLEGAALEAEATKLIKYFMAALTVPEDEMWVNLSPYEEDRIIPQAFGHTEMGRDLLAQDYLLKQLSASLVYPDDELGKKFWDRVYKKAYERFGTTDIPMNTFNKIWIVPKEAKVYEHTKGAFVVNSHLDVMLEEDYLALESNIGSTKHGLGNISRKDIDVISGVSSQVVREILIPEIEKEVNEGKTFANLRQIYHSMILAIWYKRALKDSLLGQFYVNQNKTAGVDVQDAPAMTERIYRQYLEAFEKGVYDYIKEEYDPAAQAVIPRKYFSGGASAPENVTGTTNPSGATMEAGQGVEITAEIKPFESQAKAKAAVPTAVEDTIFGRRMSGLALHPKFLPSPRGRPGTMGGEEARDYVAYLEATGQSVWDIPPAGPAQASADVASGAARSPFANDELLIDPDRLFDMGLLPEGFLDGLDGQTPKLSDREFNQEVLDAAYRMYQTLHPRMQDLPDRSRRFYDPLLDTLYPLYQTEQAQQASDDFEEYKKANAWWLEDYAVFTAIGNTQDGKPWWQWPDAYKYKSFFSHEIAQFQDQHNKEIDRIKFGQFLYDWQWQDLKAFANQHEVQLLGHMEVFVPHNSAVVWAHPEWFDLNADGTPRTVAGVPPGDSSATGQRWESPSYNWAKIREDGFQFWVGRLKRQLELFDFVLIEHFSSFDKYWSVPASGEDPGSGRWEQAPGKALLTSLQKALPEYDNKLPLIAGDSELMDDAARALRDEFRLPGVTMIGSGQLPVNYGVNTVSYAEPGDDERSPGAMIEMALNSPAALSIIRTQDMIGVDRTAQLTPENPENPGDFDRLWDQSAKLGGVTGTTGRTPSLEPEDQMIQDVNSGGRYYVDVSSAPAGEPQFQFRDRNSGASFTMSTEKGLRISSYTGRDGQEVMHSPMFFGYPLGRVEGNAYEWEGERVSLDSVKDEYQGYKLHPGKDLPVDIHSIRETDEGVIINVFLDTGMTDQIAGKATILQSIMLTEDGALVVIPATVNTGDKPVPHVYGAHNWVQRSADSSLQFTTGAPGKVFAADNNKIATQKVDIPPALNFTEATRIEDLDAPLDATFTDLPTDDKGFWEVVVWNASGPGSHVSFRGNTPAVHIWTEWGGNISVEGVTAEPGALGRQRAKDTLLKKVPVGGHAQNILIMLAFTEDDKGRVTTRLTRLEEKLLSAVDGRTEAVQPETPGGIDLNPNAMDMQLEGDRPVIVPAAPGMLESLRDMTIEGFAPSIIHVAPILDLPALLGLTGDGNPPYVNDDTEAVPSTDLGRVDTFRKPGMEEDAGTDDHV